jgi:NhaP-type Na+/H+ or K+/H+ antiporter
VEPHLIWFIVAGLLFISMALAGSAISRLPLTTAMLYLGVGVLLGPYAAGLLRLDLITHASALERVTEIAVIVSLFTAGLKLRVPVLDRRWLIAVRLAVVSMAITVGLIATAIVLVLGLPWGAAIIVGAVLAPTDPVLASDVQVEHPFDRNRLRFALTGEASLNDGTAFPFLMLGLGLLGLHDLGDGLWRWLAVDVVWATAGGLAVGAALGTAVGTLVLYLRRTHREAVGLDDFLALGLIALAYGVALAVATYGFLAVFAAGLALRRIERTANARTHPSELEHPTTDGLDEEEVAVHPDKAPGYMAEAVLAFNEHLERIGEIAVVVILGSLLSPELLTWRALWLIPLLFFVIRPLSVMAGLAWAGVTRREMLLSSWFGVRGVGSIYYLTYAIVHGLPAPFANEVIGLILAVIAASILLHGVTVTPLMSRWGEKADAAGGSR